MGNYPSRTANLLRIIALTTSTWPLLSIAQTPLTISQQTHGKCSPTISDVRGPVTVTCNLDAGGLRNNAIANLERCIEDIRKLEIDRTSYLIPAIDQYLQAPSTATWSVVREEANATHVRLRAAVESAVDYDASVADGIGPEVDALSPLHQALATKLQLLAKIPIAPPGKDWAVRLREDYTAAMQIVSGELAQLRSRLVARQVSNTK
jgi:hypothetical protein